MTLKELVRRMDQKSGAKKGLMTVDRLITGSLDAEVTGVATTFMATADVIRAAHAKGFNTIITHEPTYFNNNDKTAWAKGNPVYEEKQKLLEDTGVNIYRFHDHTHRRKPDLIYQGMTKELGWESYVDRDNERIFNLPETSVGALAASLKEKLRMPTIRLVGDPDVRCRRAMLLLGALGLGIGLGKYRSPMQLMHELEIDALLCGEILEWNTCAYARDAGQLGVNKALLALGHNRSEEAGMKYLAEWIAPLVEDVPVEFIEAGEPFLYL